MKQRIKQWAFFAAAFSLRAVLILAGYVLPVHIMYETPRTKGLNLWERYLENSWRNPTPYLRDKFTQPIPEKKPNPDQLVRSNRPAAPKKAVRVMEHGLFIEYWSLSRIESGRWKGRYWEFRIGWKFVDAEPIFWPTLQVGPKR